MDDLIYEWCGNSLDKQVEPWNSVIEANVSCGTFCYGGMVNLVISEEDKRFIAECFHLRDTLDKTYKELAEENARLLEKLEMM